MVRFKPIVPKPFNRTAVNTQLEIGMNKIGKFMQEQLNRPINTWQGAKPEFKPETEQSPDGLTSKVEGTGSDRGINKWRWLDRGTRVRYAHMTSNFSPKTSPGFIGSRAGRGGLLFVSRQRPLPGIEARNWEKEIAKRSLPKFRLFMDQAMKSAARASGHKMQ